MLRLESIPLLQQHILDAGFDELHVVSMGDVKVFIFSSEKEEVKIILIDAIEFFVQFLHDFRDRSPKATNIIIKCSFQKKLLKFLPLN